MGKWILLGWLIILSVYDVREKRVPVWMLVMGVLAVGSHGIYRIFAEQDFWLQMLLGMIPGIFLLVIAWFSQRAGYADGIVLLLVGMLQGYRECFAILCISLLLISFLSMALLLLRRVNRNTKIPYVPFMAAAFLIVRAMGEG